MISCRDDDEGSESVVQDCLKAVDSEAQRAANKTPAPVVLMPVVRLFTI